MNTSFAAARRPSIDAHAHVFVRGLPLASQRRYAPDYGAPVATYLAHLDDHGLTHGVLVQPSFLGTDNAFLVACIREAPSRLKGVAVVDADISREALGLLDAAGIVGIRLNLVGEDLPDLKRSGWHSLLDAVRERSWHVEVQRSAADVAVLGRALIDAGVDLVIDHFALPSAASGPGQAGFADVLALGATGKAWVKLSAPYRSTVESTRLADEVYPLLRDAFGLDRLMWGSDWPHTRFEESETYAGNCASFAAIVPLPDERARILAAPYQLFGFDAG